MQFIRSLNLTQTLRTSFIRNPIQRRAFSSTVRAMATEYKLKGVTSLNLKNGDKQEVEVEGIEGGKVLLLKVQDKVHATSANCTLASHTAQPTMADKFSKARTLALP
jgi:hypothetical protein